MPADLARFTEALFCSGLQPSERPDGSKVRIVVMDMVAIAGPTEVAGWVAQEFGDHPETAVARMQWCRRMVSAAQRDGASLGELESCR